MDQETAGRGTGKSEGEGRRGRRGSKRAKSLVNNKGWRSVFEGPRAESQEKERTGDIGAHMGELGNGDSVGQTGTFPERS